MSMKCVVCETLIWLTRSIFQIWSMSSYTCPHISTLLSLAPSYHEYQRSTHVQEEGLTNDLHKQAHDKKHFRITKWYVYMSKLGYRLTACEVDIFSRENMSTLPFFEEPL